MDGVRLRKYYLLATCCIISFLLAEVEVFKFSPTRPLVSSVASVAFIRSFTVRTSVDVTCQLSSAAPYYDSSMSPAVLQPCSLTLDPEPSHS